MAGCNQFLSIGQRHLRRAWIDGIVTIGAASDAQGAIPSSHYGEKKDLVQNALAQPQTVFVINSQGARFPSRHRSAPTHSRDMDQLFLVGSRLMTAAPASATTSSWESVPPEQPIAPIITPRSIRGMPPRDAITPSNASK